MFSHKLDALQCSLFRRHTRDPGFLLDVADGGRKEECAVVTAVLGHAMAYHPSGFVCFFQGAGHCWSGVFSPSGPFSHLERLILKRKVSLNLMVKTLFPAGINHGHVMRNDESVMGEELQSGRFGRKRPDQESDTD